MIDSPETGFEEGIRAGSLVLDSDEEDDEPVKVRKFEHDGTTYLRDENTNILYDLESQDEVGIWNPETKSIDELEDDE